MSVEIFTRIKTNKDDFFGQNITTKAKPLISNELEGQMKQPENTPKKEDPKMLTFLRENNRK